tara:strand:+ start:1315 stop:1524 length:210 start_codon:yes stop_codon:yes gene_type:complete
MKMSANKLSANKIVSIENAVDNLVDSWDLDTLLQFAFEDRLRYYIGVASEEEINLLLQEHGTQDCNNKV